MIDNNLSLIRLRCPQLEVKLADLRCPDRGHEFEYCELAQNTSTTHQFARNSAVNVRNLTVLQRDVQRGWR